MVRSPDESNLAPKSMFVMWRVGLKTEQNTLVPLNAIHTKICEIIKDLALNSIFFFLIKVFSGDWS